MNDFDPTRIDLNVQDDYGDPFKRRMTGIATHGHTPFSVPFISHIDGNLYVGGCEVGLLLPKEIVHVISLYRWEAYELHRNVRSKLTVTMYDSLDGASDQVNHVANWAESCMLDGPTLIHCQAGLNRSNLVAAKTLMNSNGLSAEEAIGLLREKRSPAVLCNPSFVKWLSDADR